MSRRSWAALAVAIGAMTLAPAAVGAPVLTGEFEVDGTPGPLVVDATGTAWVSVPSATGDTVRVTADGTTAGFDLPGIVAVSGITRAADGRIWAIGAAGVASFLPADPAGTAQFLPIAGLGGAPDLTFGPGGRLYAVGEDGGQSRVFIIDTGTLPGEVVNAGGAVVTGLQTPRGIAAGGDGRLHMGDFAGEQVVSFDPATGTAVGHPVGGGVQGVAAGPGEQIAYTVPTLNVIGRLSAGGAPQPTTVPGSDSFGVAYAADGAYWAPGFVSNRAIRLAADGSYTEPVAFTDPGIPPGARRVAAGPDGTVWYSLEFPGEPTGKVARIAGLEPPPVPAPLASRPKLTGVAAPRTVRAGRAIVVRARLAAPARLRVRIDRALPGRRAAAGRCVAPRPSLRRARACVRYQGLRAFARQGVAGANRVVVAPRTRTGPLRPGRYRIRISAAAAGLTSPWRTATVRVVAR